jgi:prephenate dehydrogenase
MRRVAVIGLGLMGGSIGLAAKARGQPWEIIGYTRTAATGQKALSRGAVDRLAASPAEAVRGADLAIFCAPVGRIATLVKESVPGLARGAVVTDVASTREIVDGEIPPLLKGTGAVFVGSHPVAGSEQQGIDAARADLYVGARVLLTTPARPGARALARVKAFWAALGASCRVIDSAGHDRALARTSHLPHMIASLLAASVGRPGGRADLGEFCGRGFADTSRVAEGSPEVWLDIVRTNRSNLTHELCAFRGELDRLIAALENSDDAAVLRLLKRGCAARRRLLAGRDMSKDPA